MPVHLYKAYVYVNRVGARDKLIGVSEVVIAATVVHKPTLLTRLSGTSTILTLPCGDG